MSTAAALRDKAVERRPTPSLRQRERAQIGAATGMVDWRRLGAAALAEGARPSLYGLSHLALVDRSTLVGMVSARVVAEQFFQCFGVGDLDGAFALFSPDCVALTPSGLLDNTRHHAAARALKRALPDSWMELQRVLEVGDEVYVTGRFRGTHQGDLVTPLGTLPASGRSLDLPFVDYFRVVNGLVVECEAVRDRLDMILQLGGVPAR